MSCTVYYFVDKEETAYSITIHKRPEFVTLRDFRRALGFQGSFVFHFQAFIEGFGKAKLRVSEDDDPVPFENGRAICWLESCADESLLFAETTIMTTTMTSVTTADGGGGGARFLHVTYIVVELELHLADSLGIEVVGQSERRAVGGVFVHQVRPGSAAYRDGRIEAGDSLLSINNISLENLTTEQAVDLLREVAARHSRIRLVVGKMSLPQESQNESTMTTTTASRTTPPTRRAPRRIGETISIISDSESLSRSEPSSTMAELNLTAETDHETILHALMSPDSGLDVRDRSWLKMRIRRAFTGADLVAWLFMHVEGFVQRRDAFKFADALLKHGYIVQPGRRAHFSENCYYVFGRPASLSAAASSFDKTANDEDDDEYSDSDSGSYNCGTGMGSTIEHVDSFSAPRMRVWSTVSSGSLSSAETFLTGSTSTQGGGGGSQRRTELSSPCQLYFPPRPPSSARLARLNNTAANTTLSQTLSSLPSTPGASFFN